MLLFDRHFGTSFFLPAGLVLNNAPLVGADGQSLHQGGSPLLWQHLFWFLGHPEVYILMLPALGFTSDIISTFARKPIFGYKAMVGAMLAISGLSFVVWGHHMFVSGMSPYLGMAFAVGTMLIAVPSAVKVFNWLATLWRSRIQLHDADAVGDGRRLALHQRRPLRHLARPVAPSTSTSTTPIFVVAHFHLIMAGAALFGVFGATAYWFPKMFGRMMNETLGKAHFWFTFIAYYGTFFPMHYIGIAGHMRRIYDPYQYEFLKPLQGINQFITISAFILGASQILFFVNFFWSAFKGKKASENPWNANGLEWTTPSPPPHGNWPGEIPEVHRWPYDYSVPDAPEGPRDADRPAAAGRVGGRTEHRMATEILEARVPADSAGGRRRRPPSRGRSAAVTAAASRGPASTPPGSGSGLFLGTVTMLFIGFTSAYIVRRAAADWRPLPAPALLCSNTAALLASSAALERARRRRGAPGTCPALRRWLAATGVLGLALRGRPGGGLAGAGRARLLPRLQPAQLVLLRADRRASCTWPGGLVWFAVVLHAPARAAATRPARTGCGPVRDVLALPGRLWIYLLFLLFVF